MSRPLRLQAIPLRQALLSPRSVAIVGQSDDVGKTTGRPLKYLRQSGFTGRIYPINPGRETVLGERCWASLAALPESPEHIYVVTSADAAIEAVAEGARIGVSVATLLADGFTEDAERGATRVTRLRKICQDTGIRVVGPSSLGVVDLRSKALLTANAAFDEKDLPVGRIFAASHSGSMIGALLSRGKERGIAFAGLVSVGNEVDLSLGEICAATLDDSDIDSYMLFLETMRNTEELRRFALEAYLRGKPVIAYKLGRSAIARELAITHTGALAGEDDIADAFLADCGIARVDTLDGLIEGLPLLRRVPAAAPGRRRAVGVVTTTGGGATTAIDPLAARGVAVEPPGTLTLTRLSAAGINAKPTRLLDLTLTGTRYDVMKAALDALTKAAEFDVVLCVVGSSARFYPELAVRPIIDCADSPKPIAAFLTPEAPQALAALAAAGIANFRTPEACADAIAAALRRHPPRLDLLRRVAAHSVTASGHLLDELEAYRMLAKRRITPAPSLALEAQFAGKPNFPFGYPVAVKALSNAIAHKTDVGGVVLGVTNDDALRDAIEKIRHDVVTHAGILIEKVLVQPMVTGLGEALVGYRVDKDVGPMILLAAGGVYTEIYRDRSLRLAPVDLPTAREMVSEVRGLAPLTGFRGKPKGDLEALARAIVSFSSLAEDPTIAEAEINPLIVKPEGQGVVAVDAVVRLT
jgi:acyl-CoA synthetase (NDP forming)